MQKQIQRSCDLQRVKNFIYMFWSIKPKNSQFVNFNDSHSKVEVIEKQSTKQSSQSIDLKKKSVVKKTLEDIINEISSYKPVSKFIDIDQLRKKSNVHIKRYRQCIYFGQLIQNKKSGSGIMIYTNGRIYEGQWKNNFKQGQGFEKFANLSIYNGAYQKGKPHGYGKYEWQNGENYEGQWVDGMKNGSGIWRGPQGDSYIGQWKDGKAQGYGVHTWINGNRYQGQFKQCLKHGQGIQKFANGDLYKGYYENGKPHGEGEYFWNDGSSYKGDFKQGLRCGKGIWRKSNHPSADTYQGEFLDEKKHGYGVFIWSNGSKYLGNFSKDVRDGYGEMYWSDGTVYKGQWKNGQQVQEISSQQNLNVDLYNISEHIISKSVPYENKKSKTKIDPIEPTNPQDSFLFQLQQPNEPEIIELKKFRARQLASRSKSRILQKSMINVDKGFFVPVDNFLTQAVPIVYSKQEEKTQRKMLKKSSRLSFSTTKSPYIIAPPQKGRIKHSQSTTQKKSMSVCLYSHSRVDNKSSRNIPIKNFQGVELRQDTFEKNSMRQSRVNTRTKPRMIKSSNGVRNMSHQHNNFQPFWEQKSNRNFNFAKMNSDQQTKWFTRSKNDLQHY